MNSEILYLMQRFGFDELTAWRHIREREIARRRYSYQAR